MICSKQIQILAIYLTALVSNVHAQRAELSWKPPVLPVQLSYDTTSGLDLRVTKESVTPLGSFAAEIGRDTIDDDATYFVVTKGAEKRVFCVGQRGSLKLKTSGKHNITIRAIERYNNVIGLDCNSISGAIDFEFVPNQTRDDLATIKISQHVVLRKDGSITFDSALFDTALKASDVKRLIYVDFPEKNKLYMSLTYDWQGKTTFCTLTVADQSRFQALWWIACFENNTHAIVKHLAAARQYANCVYRFTDGSVLLPRDHFPHGFFESRDSPSSWRSRGWTSLGYDVGENDYLIPFEFIKKIELVHGTSNQFHYLRISDPTTSNCAVFSFQEKQDKENTDEYATWNSLSAFVNDCRRTKR